MGAAVPQANLTKYSTTYQYDNLNRLTSATETNGWSQTYNHDEYGNLWMPSTTLPSYGPMPTTNIYNSANQNPNVGYDAAGNQTTLVGLNLSYDAENRQVLATDTTSGNSATYQYDGFGKRVAKVLGSQTIVYVYDAFGQLTSEYSSTAATAPLCGTCYLTYDYLGSVRMVTDAGGSVVARHDFTPFGQERAGRSNSEREKFN